MVFETDKRPEDRGKEFLDALDGVVVPSDSVEYSASNDSAFTSAESELHLVLDSCIYSGRRTSVWDIIVRKEPANLPSPLPPLVAKIAYYEKGLWLAQEAGVYRYMRVHQGSLIPRFYGLFCVDVSLRDHTVVPWIDDDDPPVFPRLFSRYDRPNPEACLTIMLLEKVNGSPITRELLVDSCIDESMFKYAHLRMELTI